MEPAETTENVEIAETVPQKDTKRARNRQKQQKTSRLPKPCRKGVQKGHETGRNNRKQQACRKSALKEYQKGTFTARTKEES